MNASCSIYATSSTLPCNAEPCADEWGCVDSEGDLAVLIGISDCRAILMHYFVFTASFHRIARMASRLDGSLQVQLLESAERRASLVAERHRWDLTFNGHSCTDDFSSTGDILYLCISTLVQ